MTWPLLVLKRAAELGPKAPPKLTANMLQTVCSMEWHGLWTATQAKTVLAAAGGTGMDPLLIGAALGYGTDVDTDAVVDEVIAAHPDEWRRYKGGEAKLAGFFVGKVMAATAGKADGRAAVARMKELPG